VNGFGKRFYTPRAFARDLREVLVHLPSFRETARSDRVPRSFAERVMLAEIAQILAGELGDLAEEEAVALAFAQHWAETAGHPDPDAERSFREHYGPQVSTDILNWIRMIQMGNLMGNTFDALLYSLGIRRRHVK
jgi:hypothetical protein